MWTPHEIKKARTLRGMSMADLATALNVSTRTIARWEAGEAAPTHGQLRQELAQALGLNIPNPAPALDQATDTEMLAEQARRLAAKDRMIVKLQADIERLRGRSDDSAMGD